MNEIRQQCQIKNYHFLKHRNEPQPLFLYKNTPMTKIVKDSENENERDYILQDNKKTVFGASFIIAVLVLLVIAVLTTAFYLDWF